MLPYATAFIPSESVLTTSGIISSISCAITPIDLVLVPILLNSTPLNFSTFSKALGMVLIFSFTLLSE